jgi:hypothetical protein
MTGIKLGTPESGKGSRLWFLGFLLFYLLFAFATFHHYGDTCDEIDCYSGGGVMLRYYAGHSSEVLKPEWSSHNYIYPAFLRLFSFNKGILLDRLHLLNLLFALSAFWACYELLFLYCGDGRWALAGPLALFLTPRFLGDIPANPKDATFAVLYFVSLASMILAKQWFRHRWARLLCLGFVFGFTFCNRVVGLTLFPLYAVFRVYEEVVTEKNISRIGWKRWLFGEIRDGAFLFLVSQLVACAFWPYLSVDYFHHFRQAITEGQKFEWDSPILFWGGFVQPSRLPWTYLPGWIVATTPLFHMFFFLWAVTRWKSYRENSSLFLMTAAFFFNLSLYFLLRPVIYNGYRHFLYLIPMLVFTACLGAADFFRNVKQGPVRWMAMGLVTVNILMVASHLVRLYPYDYVYFNELVGGVAGANGKFEMDYWGQSLRESALWMKDNIPRVPGKIYHVKLDGSPWQETNYFPDYMTGDVKLKAQDADYEVVLNGLKGADLPPGGRIVHIVEREGVPLTYILQMKGPGAGGGETDEKKP